MVAFTFFLACLLVFVSKSRSTFFEEHDGEVFLESVVHFHDGNNSIPMMNLDDFLLLLANKTAGAEGTTPADPQVGVLHLRTYN